MCLPDPAHVPYLWSIYQENVEPLIKTVHVPTMDKIFRDARHSFHQLTTAYQALVLAIYYGAIVSLEPDDVLSSLGQSKDEALARYRFAVQQALSRADFLTTSDITVLQALSIFVTVVRHHDQSRVCWSLTGLAIHIARGMGLHRDGSHLDLSPFEREMRRRIWWGLLTLDLRSAEELGTDLIVGDSTFDTQMPSNINDRDISPDTLESPRPRDGCSDTTLFLVRCEICSLGRRIIEAGSMSATVEEQQNLLMEVHQRVDQKFFKWIDEPDPLYEMAAMLSLSLKAKLCLVIYEPVLFPCIQENGVQSTVSDEARQCVYVSAVNLIEYYHILQVAPRCQRYRWHAQTYTNWYAMAYFLIESCRRPWTPLVERGWQALHGYKERSIDYIQSPAYESKVLPIKRLWLRASRYRAREIARLGANLEEAYRLDHNERMTPVIFPFGEELRGQDRMMDLFRARWLATIRAGNAAMPTATESVRPARIEASGSCLPQSIPSYPQTFTLGAAGTEGSVGDELCENVKSSYRTVSQSPGFPLTMPWPLPPIDWSEMDDGSAGEGQRVAGQGNEDTASHETGLDMCMNPQTTRLPSNNPPPPFWSGLFATTTSGFDELESAEIDMFGDDFDWQGWAKNIRGFGM